MPRKFMMIAAQSLLLCSISACATHEFARVGSSDEQRDADSERCIEEGREAAKQQQQSTAGQTSDQRIVGSFSSGYTSGKAIAQYHKECMAKLGYESVKLN